MAATAPVTPVPPPEAAEAPAPRLEAVLLLAEYGAAQGRGAARLRAALWGLARARRDRPDLPGAAGVRRDLAARVRLAEKRGDQEAEEEPALDAERVVLLAVQEQLQQEKENRGRVGAGGTTTAKEADAAAAAVSSDGAPSPHLGLRNRHSRTDYASPRGPKEAACRADVPEDPATAAAVPESDLAALADPLQLLGGALPPRSLREAQAEARAALAAYIEAADLLRELQRLMSSQT